MTTQIRSIGDLIAVRNAAGPAALTAAGTGDNTAVTGVIIDRAALNWPQSCTVVIPFIATLAAAATLSVTATLQDGDNSALSDAATFAAIASGVAATGESGGSTEQSQIEVDVSLAGAKRYVRLNFTPDLSAGATDTARVGAVIAFGGSNRLPI
ncbi:hypothetical protein [Pararhodobacter zhoushanensis]|uniref:hypothetical protein n=1 Tax=Pararhodobacter zhoushanensis TaxID=2479545 RepID=UPI000F8C6DD3|nr:hypothetical protein [Pararhodobacter zhoushanensis]